MDNYEFINYTDNVAPARDTLASGHYRDRPVHIFQSGTRGEPGRTMGCWIIPLYGPDVITAGAVWFATTAGPR